MDASALERAIATAEKSFDCWSFWLLIATLIVVVGLVVEYFPDIRKLLTERPIDRMLLIEMIGGVLVTVGVAGELGVQFFQSAAETSLRDANHRYVALLQQNTEGLRKANIASQQALETERKERLELQARVAWRHLDDGQLQAAIVALLPFPNLPYDRVIGADAESLNLLSELTRVFSAPALHWVAKQGGGGIALRDSNGVTIGIFVGTDVQITYDASRESDFGSAAKALASALVADGIKAIAEVEPPDTTAATDQRIHIKIGSRPAF